MRRPARLLLVGGLLVGAVPAPAPAIPDTVRIPAERPRPEGTPPPVALFSHWGHARYRCFACHPGLFPQAPQPVTHAAMNQGRFCGRCHRTGGEAAAPATMACERCHVAR